jgi:hypothetical protein
MLTGETHCISTCNVERSVKYIYKNIFVTCVLVFIITVINAWSICENGNTDRSREHSLP